MRPDKLVAIAFASAALALVQAPGSARAVPIVLDTWMGITGESMLEGEFYNGIHDDACVSLLDCAETWTITVTDGHVKLWVTDIFVVSDQFEIYDNGALIATTPSVDDWDDLGLPSSGTSPPWTPDPDAALADGRFSAIHLGLGLGDHSLAFRNIHIPNCSIDPDVVCATSSFRFMVAVPAPASLSLFAVGLAALGFMRRRRRKAA